MYKMFIKSIIYAVLFIASMASSYSGNFKMRTGSYIGNNSYELTKIFKGMDFEPQLIIFKSDTNTNSAGFVTSLDGSSTNAFYQFNNATNISSTLSVDFTTDGFALVGTGLYVTEGKGIHLQQ